MSWSHLALPSEDIAAFCRRHHIRKLSLFGSVLRDDFGPGSDVDVLVEFEPGHVPGFGFITLQDELSAILGHRVDLHTPRSLSRYFRAQVLWPRRSPSMNATDATRNALDELQTLIRQHHPTAVFAVFEGEDPPGVYLEATVDVADTDAVMDIIIARLLPMQVEETLPVYVIPVRPLTRVVAATIANAAQR